MRHLHRFSADVSGIELPRQFTYPFHYVPHDLCHLAASQVYEHVFSHEPLWNVLREGKMLGVLVVRGADGELGFLAACSGNIQESVHDCYFVPPIYDLLAPGGVFKRGEAEITAINKRIKALETAPIYDRLQNDVDMAVDDLLEESESQRFWMDGERKKRQNLRCSLILTPEDEEQLRNESRHAKAEYRRYRKRQRAVIEAATQRLDDYESTIRNFKEKRRAMSEDLQRHIFDLYVVLNALGETKTITQIFEQTMHKLPPAGTGDCCAPKLLQHAYSVGLEPLCMAEFWVGESPKGEVRHEGHFYPACRSKCFPLLGFMLQGLDVEENPLNSVFPDAEIIPVYEDEWLCVIDKPAGLLSVPGKESDVPSVLELMRKQGRAGENWKVAHRLDQATSGLLVIAKTHQIYTLIQQQFTSRLIGKRYLALLDGRPQHDSGRIELPLRPDPDDRPRQVVDFVHGKPAVTEYRVLESYADKTLVMFSPLTGRTHQLRVHASHPDGLNCPITGDMLYGTAATRLHLHAYALEFTHPVTGRHVSLKSAPPFL